LVLILLDVRRITVKVREAGEMTFMERLQKVIDTRKAVVECKRELDPRHSRVRVEDPCQQQQDAFWSALKELVGVSK
jgi:hypothetical protein